MPVYSRFFQLPQQGPVKVDPKVLRQIGPLLNVEVSVPSVLAQYLTEQDQPIPAPVSGLALIDTGASRSCVDVQAIESLGVSPIGVTTIGSARGLGQHNLYPAKFRFPGVALETEFSSVVGVDLKGQSTGGQDIVVLVGRDVLSHCVLIYNGPGGFFTLAF